MLAFSARQQSFNARLLDRFYGIFVLVCVVFLTIGVPFVFVRKTVSAAATLTTLAGVLLAWRISRRGQPQQSLKLFAVGLWTVLVALLFAGLPPVTAATALAMAVMLATVVNLRAGVIFGASYLVAWLLYIALVAANLAPPPFFTGATLTGWFVAAVATWLVLLPIPEMIRNLREAASMQVAVIEAASDGILVVNMQGKVETFNQRFADMWRIPPAVLQSRDDADLLNTVMQQLRDPESFVHQVRELYARPDQSSLDFLRFKDGRAFERQSRPQRLDQQIVGRVWSFRDVTEHERSQLALQNGKEQFEAILNATTESIFLVDRLGKILAINATAASRMNIPQAQLPGRCVFDFFPPEVSATRRGALDEVFQTGRIKCTEDKRGERSFALTYYPVVSASGAVESVVVFAANITEQKKAERAAQAQAQRNQLLMQTATEGIHIVDEHGYLVEANEAFSRMLGYSPAELAHAPVTQWDARWNDDQLAEKIAQLIKHGGAFETVHRRRDGSLLDVEVHATGVCLGGQTYLYAASRDISERKRSEAKLVAREARLASFMAALQDTVVVLDEQARVVEYIPSPGTSHPAFQATDQWVLGKTCAELMPVAVATQFAGAVAALQAGGLAQSFDFSIVTTQQTYGFVTTMSRMADASGYFTVVRDVSARRAARREIERLGQRNALLLESVGEGIFDVDQNGNTSFANPAALSMLGLTQMQILGQDQHTLFHHHHADGSLYRHNDCPVHKTLQDGLRRRLDSEWFWRQDGTGFPVSMVVTPIDEDGKRVGVVVLFQDITDRKRSEEEIHRLAFHDTLTQLPNRRLLLDRLGQMLASSKRSGMYGAVLFMDLDNFKPLNDAQGHSVGDMLLLGKLCISVSSN